MKRKYNLFLFGLVMLLFGSSHSFAQKIDMKRVLVDFFKELNSLPKIQVDPMISKNYSLSSIENTKSGHLYLGVPPSSISSSTADTVLNIINSLMNKNYVQAEEFYEKVKNVPNSRILELLIKADKALREFNYDQALQYLDECIRLNPNNEYAYYVRAKILNSLGNTKEAKKNIIYTFALNPNYTFYQIRNKYLLKQLKVELKNRWFVPKWIKTENGYKVQNELWKYYVQALLVFQKYSVAELREITGIANKDIAIRIIAIHVMLHYAKLNSLMDDEMKKIEKIIDKEQLPGFILVEIMPYFWKDFNPLNSIDVEKAFRYFNQYYVK